MIGKILLCFVVAVAVLTSAFKPLKSQYQRKAESQMHLKSSLDQQWGKALAILTLTAGFYSSPVLADEITAVAPPAKSVLKSVLNDYKEKSVPVAVAPPVVTTPPVKKAVPIVVKKVIPPVAAKKVDIKVEVPAPAPPAPIVYSIKPDTDLLKKLEATRSKSGESSKEAKKIAVNEVKKVDIKEVKKVEIKAEVKMPETKTNAAIKIVEKVPVKSVSTVNQKTKPPPAVAIPVTVKPVVKAAIVKAPAIPEEKALVEAYNKKAGTKSKLDQLNVNIKTSKQQMIQARSDMKKQESKMEVFDKKLAKGDLDKDLKRSLIEDRKEEEKIYNQVPFFAAKVL